MTAQDEAGTERSSQRLGVKCSFVAIPVSTVDGNWVLAGELRVPNPEQDRMNVVSRWPAVVIVHGSAGVDSRGLTYARALNAAGMATLEIDLWAARGVQSPAERPRSVVTTLPDAFAALSYLAGRADIDPAHIGIMGFSWGGVVAMLTATRKYSDSFAANGIRFAGHAPLYPLCWIYNSVPGYEFGELTGAPVFVQAGVEDKYDGPETALTLARASANEDENPPVRVVLYDGATHAWDRREADIVITDPTAHQGKGGAVPFVFNSVVAERSCLATVDFFQKILRP